jgi:photosystem II stability/assembly factor-like uncharacterized protein
MKFSIYVFLIFWFSVAYCQVENNRIFISVDTVQMGKMSIRALVPEKDRVWFAANQGRFGYHDFAKNVTFEKRIVFDSLKPEFRSIAETKDNIFLMSITNPALLYQVDKQTIKPKLVYTEKHEKVFYDSMKFWNDKEGIVLGDPTEDCFSVLITRDGGNNWSKMPCVSLPKVSDGEAAFAASNTNIVLKDDRCWIVSGGKMARVFYSPDKGKSWQVFETPIVQGQQMTGIYTADFYDANIGIVAGGNYENQEANSGNKATTIDGGKTWRLVSENSGFGYASCIQFIPKSKGKELVCVGGTGLWYSPDSGLTWQKLLNDKTLYTISFFDDETAYAAGKDKILRIKFKK